MMSPRVTRVTRWMRTRLGMVTVLALGAALWGALGLPGARPAAVIAVITAGAIVILKLSYLSRLSARVNTIIRSQSKDGSRRDRKLRRLESRATKATTAIKQVERRLEATRTDLGARAQRTLDDHTRVVDALRTTNARLSEMAEKVRAMDETLTHATNVNAELLASHNELSDELSESTTAARRAWQQAHADSTGSLAFARAGLRSIRGDVLALHDQLPAPAPLTDIDAITTSEPLLSIAIPGHNRPREIAECLQSIVDQVLEVGDGRVEVWVTDDASIQREAAQTAHAYATEHPFVGFRANPQNLGLEANFHASCAPCRGEYVWVIGNDDRLRRNALRTVLEDCAAGTHDALLYAQTRIDHVGTTELPMSAGITPPGVPAGRAQSYSGAVDLAAETGIVSSFGFASTLVVRRERLLKASPVPYMGLSRYPQLGILLEATADSPVQFRNTVVVSRRSMTPLERLAEATGRHEEAFFSVGSERDRRWFGAGYAALLQRAIDRSALDVAMFLNVPERHFGATSMVEWIAANRQAAHDAGTRLSPEVEVDADRFLAAAAKD